MVHVMSHAQGKRGVVPFNVTCGYLSEGKTTQDKSRGVQSQNMQSKGAMQKSHSCKFSQKGAKQICKTTNPETRWSLGKEGIVPSDLLKSNLHQVKQ